MALSTIHDMDISTTIPAGGSQDPIPDDIWEAAILASQQDTDGEDPYEPQPKRFMQTEHQRRRQKRDLEIRKVARALRKGRKEKRERLKKQRQKTLAFEKLPPELMLKVMQHTHVDDLLGIRFSSDTNSEIFRANKTAIYRGIEIEQFPDWKWLFGDSKRRSSAQSQHLKDALFSEWWRNPGYDWKYEEVLAEYLQDVDDNKFKENMNVILLQTMQDVVDDDIIATESYMNTKIARRTVMCLRILSHETPVVVKNGGWIDDYGRKRLVDLQEMPWKARSQLINEQPASIQAEIRSIFETVLENIFYWIEKVPTKWIERHYTNPDLGQHRKPQEVRKWMSDLVTGLILEEVVPRWYTQIADAGPRLVWMSDDFCYLEDQLQELLGMHDSGYTNILQEVKDGIEFGKLIGLNHDGILDGTSAGDYLGGFEGQSCEKPTRVPQ